MISNTLDGFAHSNGIRHVNVYYKILFALLTLIVCLVSTSPIIPLFITFIMSFLIIFLAKIPFKFYIRFLSIPFIFGFITFIFMAIFFGVGELWFNLGIFNLAVYKDGFDLGFLVFARIMGCFSCLAFLSLTTPMTELFSVLERVKIPKIVLELAMLMYRFIFVFLDEALNMYHAQETRLGYSSLRNTYKSMGLLASNLFIRTWLKGEHAYISMESRGYDGSLKSLNVQKNIEAKNLILLIIFEVLLIFGTYLTGTFKLIQL
jgi:cobalt/nickel transport system permease protein